MQIYPNPTTSQLNIKIPDQLINNYDFTILDAEGKVVKQGEIDSNQTAIEIKQLAEGKYILTFKSSKNIITGHFIIKH